MKLFLVVAITFWVCLENFGQQITIRTPSLPIPQGPSIPNPQYNLTTSNEERNRINERIVEQDIRNYELQKKEQRKAIKEAYKDLGVDDESGLASPYNRINYTYAPNKAYSKIHFENALHEIMDMVERRKPYNVKRAIFLTEHAYDTTLNYAQFERQIAKLVEVIQLKMKKDKLAPGDNLGKIMAVFQFMADTISVRHPVLEKTITTYPKLYDFEDFYGLHDYRQLFVSKLIRTGKGQCHSLPLLFLILCQEIGATAYLSFSPEHSYIKFKDNTGAWHNMELTNQMLTTDQFILQSGYIKSAAIKSRIYMDTLEMSRVILSRIDDLANSYVKKYGYDDFPLNLAQVVLERYPNSIAANMHAANYYNVLDYRIKKQYDSLGYGEQHFWQDEKFKQVRRMAIHWNKHMDELGYAEMPPDIYAKWLGLLKDESMRQQYLDRKRMLQNMIEH